MERTVSGCPGRLAVAIFCLSTGLAVAGPVSAEESDEVRKLTVDEALEKAVSRKAFVRRRRARLDRARAERRATTKLPNPSFLYDREQWWQQGEVYAQDWFLVEQSLELPGVRTARRSAADARVEAARHRRAADLRRRRTEIRADFFELVALRRRLDRATDWVERLEQVRATVRKRAGRGELSTGDVHRITAELETARAETNTLRAELERRKREFLTRVGVEGPPSTWRIQGSLESPKVDASPKSAAAAVSERADLDALEAAARAARSEAREARRSWISSVGLHGGYIRIGEPGLVAHGFAVGIGVPLPLLNQNRGAAAEASARAAQLEARLKLRRRRLTTRARGLAREAKKKRRAAEQFREQGLEAATQLVEKLEAAYESGSATLFELLDAERSLFEAHQTYAELLWSAARVEIELAGTIGRSKDRSSQPPPE